MEVQIKDLVASIRKEGIETANNEAEQIIADAKKQAEEIVSKANAEAKNAKDAAEKEISILKESAKVGAEQAKRDAMLSFKTQIKEEFEKILKANVKKNLSGEALGKLIRAVAEGEDISGYAAEVAEVSDGLKSELAAEIENGLEIRPSRNVQAGFRLAAKDGSGYFDCSDEEIMQIMMPYFRDLDF